MTAVLTIGRTELRFGYFYRLLNTREVEPRDDWIVCPSPTERMPARGICTVVGAKHREVRRFKCSIDPAHGIQREVWDYELDLTYAPQPFTPFMNECDHVIINAWLAER